MAELQVALLGLGRVGASIGLALKRYMRNKGKHQFKIIGFDSRSRFEKQAREMNVVDQIVGKAYKAVENVDIVVMSLSYDEVKATYEYIAPDLRDGVVILDMSPLKQPSLQWATKYLTEEHHLVGVTPIVNPKYLFDSIDDTKYAAEDLFDAGSMLLMPGVHAIKEAVDLAFSFSSILGATPHFVDPVEHDVLRAATEELASVLGVAAFYTLMRNQGWNDIQRVTNPTFGALTHNLYDKHPDELRDEWLFNRERIVRNMDEVIVTLQNLRDVLDKNDKDALEAVLVSTSSEYEKWYNRRYHMDWSEGPDQDYESPSVMSSLLGSSLAGRLQGRDDD